MGNLKFGSPAWRAKYMKKTSRTNSRRLTESERMLKQDERRRKRELKAYRAKIAREDKKMRSMYRRNRDGIYTPPVKSRSTARSGRRNSSHSRGTAAKRKRMREMIAESKPRKNPPSSWTKVKAFRVVKKNGLSILEVKK